LSRVTLLLSFDHELSLGGADCYHRNLFDPTERILDLAGELDVPVSLFTDVLCALRFDEWDPTAFTDPWERQIGRALHAGHDVQLHLHPHWMTTRYEHGRILPSSDYTLSHFREVAPPDDIRGLVSRGAGFLTERCRRHMPDYRCVAYRAGGFNLAPETPVILGALHDEGIRIESSIAKGFHFESSTSRIDYRNMPARANWFIDPAGPLDREAESGLYEIPVAGRPRTPVNNLPFLVKRVLRHGRAYASGGHEFPADATSAAGRLARLFPRSTWVLGFDRHTDSVSNLLAILRHHVAGHDDDEVVCAAVSHPKHMGDHQLSLMEGFVRLAREAWGDRLRFASYRQVFDEKGLGGGAAS
jgi:hypothetical protein